MGDLSFDDWYETPVFEAEPDERLEHLATSRRAPMRLFAGALLRVAPDQRRRPRHGRAPAPVEVPAETPVTFEEPGEETPVAIEAPIAETPIAETPIAETSVAAETPAAQAGTAAPSRSLRSRAGQLLDRWAAMETASQERLEAVVLPKRWRG